jgi:hypothetical protein
VVVENKMNDFKKGLLVGIVIMSSIFLFIASTSPKMESKDRREIIEYKLLGYNNSLSENVNLLISQNDWQPFGSPFCEWDERGAVLEYFQAMVRYKED